MALGSRHYNNHLYQTKQVEASSNPTVPHRQSIPESVSTSFDEEVVCELDSVSVSAIVEGWLNRKRLQKLHVTRKSYGRALASHKRRCKVTASDSLGGWAAELKNPGLGQGAEAAEAFIEKFPNVAAVATGIEFLTARNAEILSSDGTDCLSAYLKPSLNA